MQVMQTGKVQDCPILSLQLNARYKINSERILLGRHLSAEVKSRVDDAMQNSPPYCTVLNQDKRVLT